MLLVSDSFNHRESSVIQQRRNHFRNGVIKGNITETLPPIRVERGAAVEQNTVLDCNGMMYYVVISGVTAREATEYGEEYVTDGSAVLKRIND